MRLDECQIRVTHRKINQVKLPYTGYTSKWTGFVNTGRLQGSNVLGRRSEEFASGALRQVRSFRV